MRAGRDVALRTGVTGSLESPVCAGRAAHQLRAVHGRARRSGRRARRRLCFSGSPRGPPRARPRQGLAMPNLSFCRRAWASRTACPASTTRRRETGRQRSGVRIDRHRVQVFSWGDLDPAEGYRGLVAGTRQLHPESAAPVRSSAMMATSIRPVPKALTMLKISSSRLPGEGLV